MKRLKSLFGNELGELRKEHTRLFDLYMETKDYAYYSQMCTVYSQMCTVYSSAGNSYFLIVAILVVAWAVVQLGALLLS